MHADKWISGLTLRVPRNDGSDSPMPIDHLNPPTGQMADNVIGFARALRAAGIPVGPGAVIDALNALQVIEIGNRSRRLHHAGGDLRQAP